MSILQSVTAFFRVLGHLPLAGALTIVYLGDVGRKGPDSLPYLFFSGW